jgi:hypothetical protein
MADLNEEQLLNELLRDLGAADGRMPGPDLEARVMAAWDAEQEQGKRGRAPFARASYIFGIAAMVTLAAMVTMWNPAPVAPVAPIAPVALVAPVAPVAPVPPIAPVAPSVAPKRSTASALAPGASAFAPRATADKTVGKPVAPTFATEVAAADRPVAPVAPVAPVLAQSPIEFVPLLPMTEQELTGSFQIVRVQMPRASLGALTSPLHHPSELVEADVLLGEDGRARGIHISTSGSVSPWRPR